MTETKNKYLLNNTNSLLGKWSLGSPALSSKISLLSKDEGSVNTDGDQHKKHKLCQESLSTEHQKKKKSDAVLDSRTGHQSGSLTWKFNLSGAKSDLTSTKLNVGNLKLSTSLSSTVPLTSCPLNKDLISSGLSSISVQGPSLNPLLGSSLSVPSFHLKSNVFLSTKSRGVISSAESKILSDIQKEKVQTIVDQKGRHQTGKSKKKKMKLEVPLPHNLEKYTIPPPNYHFRGDEVFDTEIVIPAFVPPSRDTSLFTGQITSSQDLMGIKNALINAVSGSLLNSPNFRDKSDFVRGQLLGLTDGVNQYDPEFVLKLALYTRRELNIRTTANFLLAVASHSQECRPFLRKYYCACIVLPSDWIEVAEIYQAFQDKHLNFGSLPAALRKVMIKKFTEFDQYQLAKYNKEKSHQKKKKKLKEKDATKDVQEGFTNVSARGRGGFGSRGRRGRGAAFIHAGTKRPGIDNDSSSSDEENETANPGMHGAETSDGVVLDEQEESEVELKLKTFTLKQLIRKLHITEPVEHVMCLIGKKYPADRAQFLESRLPGVWEEERADKRMKLPVPETWETQVSLRGNKAEVWQDLIDHRKLPFMAMLRNLRNLIKAGISPEHHTLIIRRLTNQRQVINSKQFPFRFFSAYEVLTQLEQDYLKSQEAIIQEATITADTQASGRRPEFRGRGGRGRGARGGRGKTKQKDGAVSWWIKRNEKKKLSKSRTQETPYDVALIQRYRKALDTAVKIATVHNVQPIKGLTIIICSIDQACRSQNSSANLGKKRNVAEVQLLLALMCKYSCEDSQLIVHDLLNASFVQLKKGTILENMDRVYTTDLANVESSTQSQKVKIDHGIPHQMLEGLIRDRIQVDNLIVLGQGLEPPSQDAYKYIEFTKCYRRVVNPNLLFVTINADSRRCQLNSSFLPEHENDVYISGFSDAILRFIAERGSGGQLLHVENMDQAYNLEIPTPLGLESVEKRLRSVAPEHPLPISSLVPSWRTARVFISSTFRDMHGERDLLTRFVFPELRALGRKHFIYVYEVDLRWGVTEEQANTNRTLEMCLQEITKSQLFVGLLGERYGWVPSPDQIPDTPEFDCVRNYPPGASVTELEMHFGALSDVKKTRDKAFFFIRDNAFEKDIPSAFKQDFASEDEESQTRMKKLKSRVRGSGLEVFDNYPCAWGGVVDKKPIVAGLEQFAQRALTSLWLAIQRLYPDEDAMLDEDFHITRLHRAFVDSRHGQSVGRQALIKECVSKLIQSKSGFLGLSGKSGSGKSSIMASVIHEYVESKHCPGGHTVFVHMVGAAPGSTILSATLRRLSQQIVHNFGLDIHIPSDYKNLVITFATLLREAGKMCGTNSRLVLFLDGLYQMEDTHQPCNLEWLPNPLPSSVVVMISAVQGDVCHASLVRLKADTVMVGALDMFEKADIVRKTLAKHRKTLAETPFNNQLKFLMAKKDAHNPLFLKMACEELRMFGVFEQVTDKLKGLSHTTPQLLQEVLSRLETDHGVDIVSTTVSLLACVREGLFAEELYELLTWYFGLNMSRESIQPRDLLNRKYPSSAALPAAVFAYLQRSVQSFLNPLSTYSGSVRLTLANQEIALAIRKRYLTKSDADRELQLHRLLAGYFMRLADPDGDISWKGKVGRAFSELPYHLTCAGCFRELEETLCSLNFIHAKFLLGQASLLMDDFLTKGLSSKSLEKEQKKFLANSKVQAYQMFVSSNLHILTSYPALTWQQAGYTPDDSLVFKEVSELRASGQIKDDLGYMEWKNKPQCPDPCYLNLANLQQPVTCIAISPDSTYFATGGLDCLIHLYDLGTGKEVRFFRGHSDAITDVYFVGKDKLCSASVDASLSLWDVEHGHRIALWTGHTRRVNACVADRSAKVVASAGWDCKVFLWNVSSGEHICDFNLDCPVNDVDFHPEGQLIVTASWDATIKIFDILYKTRKAVLRGHLASVRSVSYSNDGCHIASASCDGEVKIWSAVKGVQVGSVRGHGAPINKLMFSPSGKELITASDDHQIKVWSGELGVPLNVIGSDTNGPATAVSLSHDASSVAVGYHSGHVRVFDANTGLQMFESKSHTKAVRAVCYSEDSLHILSGSDDTKVHILEATQGSRICSLEGHTGPVLSIQVNKKYIATTSEDFTGCLYPPIRTAKQTKVVRPLSTLAGHIAPVTSCSFSPRAEKLATASRDMTVKIWNLRVCEMDPSPTPESTLKCHSDWINSCGWSNTAEFLVTASNDFTIRVWDLKTKEEKFKLTGHTAIINTMAYKFGCIVSGASNGQVKIWSHRGTEITTLFGHTLRVNGCDLYVKCGSAEEKMEENDDEAKGELSWLEMAEKDEQREILPTKLDAESKKAGLDIQDVVVASCGDDGTVRLWRPLEANILACLNGHSDRVLAVSADHHNHVASAGLDCSVRLWSLDLVNEKHIASNLHEMEITCLSSGCGGYSILSADRSGVVKIWQHKEKLGLTCVCTFKAHSKAVSAVCFVNKDNTRFVTASHDMTMAAWETLCRKDGIVVRKSMDRCIQHPVNSLIWSPAFANSSCVVGSSWNGHLFVWNMDSQKFKAKDFRIDAQPAVLYTRWITSLTEMGSRLIATHTSGHVSVLGFTHLKEDPFELQPFWQSVVNKVDINMQPISATYPQAEDWILCSAVSRGEDGFYVGDSRGQLNHYNFINHSWNQSKVHQSAIIAVAVADEFVFTASKDCTVKVWKDNFCQVGQFFCQAPVTSLCCFKDWSGKGVYLMVGDFLGNLHQLKWTTH